MVSKRKIAKISGSDVNKDVLPKSPVVFKSPNLQPDVRIKVFDAEFHVHSTILKLHSNFFRKFLDGPDKLFPPASSTFPYDYISYIEDDGDWGLARAHLVGPEENLSSLLN